VPPERVGAARVVAGWIRAVVFAQRAFGTCLGSGNFSDFPGRSAAVIIDAPGWRPVVGVAT